MAGQNTYRIGEVAEGAGVSVPAIRYYERVGLLSKAPRTNSGNRRYPEGAIERIRFIKQAQRHGLTLAEIRGLITVKSRGGSRRCQQVQRLLTAKIAELDQQLAHLDEFRRTLQALADQCDKSLTSASDPDCPVIARI